MDRFLVSFPEPINCSVGNGGCTQLCVPEVDANKCDCKPGYELLNMTLCIGLYSRPIPSFELQCECNFGSDIVAHS